LTIQDFVEHLDSWKQNGIPYSIPDLVDLAKKCNCPIPDEFKDRSHFDIKINKKEKNKK
jgi:hypothetical protein